MGEMSRLNIAIEMRVWFLSLGHLLELKGYFCSFCSLQIVYLRTESWWRLILEEEHLQKASVHIHLTYEVEIAFYHLPGVKAFISRLEA